MYIANIANMRIIFTELVGCLQYKNKIIKEGIFEKISRVPIKFENSLIFSDTKEILEKSRFFIFFQKVITVFEKRILFSIKKLDKSFTFLDVSLILITKLKYYFNDQLENR